MATALDVAEVPGAHRADTLVDALAGRDLVVVLDNCEHLVRQGLPELVERLRTRCATVTFLATSREALGVAGESVHPVPPLSTPDPAVPGTLAELATYDSVRLFLDRAAEHGRPVLEDDAGPVATLCAALDGLPLAIELAAARTPVLTPAQIVRRLHDRFGLLDFGTRAAFPPHHRALGTALAWSYDLLSADEAALFTRLGVFVGGFCVEGAEAVWQADGTLDARTGLVAKSLVRVGRAGSSTRFFVLETIAAYAAERLAADPVAETMTKQRHAAFFRDRAEEAALDPTGAGFAELRVEHENLRVAMSFFAGAEDRAGELRMAAALSGYYRRHGHYREGRQRLERAVARSGEVPADLRGNALTAAAALALSECDYDRADRHAADALASAVAAGNQGLAGRSLVLLGAVAMQRAEYAAALDHYSGAVAAFCAPAESRAGPRAHGDRGGAASPPAHPGAVARYRRERAEVRRLLEQALATFGELDLTEHVARTLGLLGLVEHGDGNHGEAARLLRRSLGPHRDRGDRGRQAGALRAATGPTVPRPGRVNRG